MKLKEMLETSKLKKNILKISLLTVFILSLNSLSYAYFTSNIEGKGNEMALSTSDISIRFQDSAALKKTGLTPGSTITKTFTITNNSSSSVKYKINWEYLINNFVGRVNLVYKVTSNNGGGALSETQLPDSEEHINILNNLTINSGITQTYTMTITYKDNGQNQDLDKNKSLIGKLEVTDINGNSILPETSTGSSSSEVPLEKTMYGMTVKELADIFYPVGSLYTSTTDKNPGEIYGGKWERYAEGKTLIGVNESDTSFASANKTGGSKTINLAHSHTVDAHTHTTQDHTLTIDEMPAHNHLLQEYNNTTAVYTSAKSLASSQSSTNLTWSTTLSKGSSGYSNTSTLTTSRLVATYNGGGGAHNHGDTTMSSPGTNSKLSTAQSVLDPFITVYMWKRIS